MAKGAIKCEGCNYCKGVKGNNATRYGFHCQHPDQKHIGDYFREHRLTKMDGFIGFGKCFGDKPEIKTSPAWCPKKKE